MPILIVFSDHAQLDLLWLNKVNFQYSPHSCLHTYNILIMVLMICAMRTLNSC